MTDDPVRSPVIPSLMNCVFEDLQIANGVAVSSSAHPHQLTLKTGPQRLVLYTGYVLCTFEVYLDEIR